MTGCDLTTRDVLEGWSAFDTRRPAHLRLHALLARSVPQEELAAESLGARNQRLIRFARTLRRAPLEATCTCTHCGTEIEFTFPEDAILSAPTPAPDMVVRPRGGVGRYRVPNMGDLWADPEPRHLIVRCRLDATPGGEDAPDTVGSAFDAADPAGNMSIQLVCPDCGTAQSLSLDPAPFVAAELDRIQRRLLNDIHLLASAYGWSEAQILALPTARRRAYCAMIAGQGWASAGRAGLA